MSSGFVSGGTIDRPVERNELWKRAEQEVENARRRKEEVKAHDGKSLYEVLQANKAIETRLTQGGAMRLQTAAKQEAFEEAAKLKNQFRSLDEDDVNFLNSIRDADLARDSVTRQETRDQIDVFRKQQQQQQQQQEMGQSSTMAEANRLGVPEDGQHAVWHVTTKKRKRADNLKGAQAFKGAKAIKAFIKGNRTSSGSDETPSARDDVTTTREEQTYAEPASPDLEEICSRPRTTRKISAELKTSTAVTARSSRMLGKKPLAAPDNTEALGLSGYCSDDS